MNKCTDIWTYFVFSDGFEHEILLAKTPGRVLSPVHLAELWVILFNAHHAAPRAIRILVL